MTQSKKSDLTQGNILNKILLMAIPLMATQFFQMMYTLVDMFFLGRIDSYSVAASGTASMYIWLTVAFFIIARAGAEIGVSQSLGKKDSETAKKYSYNACFIALILGVFYGAILFFLSPQLISFFRLEEAHVVADAIIYLSILGLCLPFNFVSFAFIGSFNGAGNSKLPSIIKAGGLGINIILSPLFIFTFGMGIKGAAIATVIAQACAFFTYAIMIKYHKDRPFEEYHFRNVFKPDKKIITQIFKWSMPLSIESACFTILTMIISREIATFGAGAMATLRVGSQVEALSWLIGVGFATAITAFVGQNDGAKKNEQNKKGVRISLILMSIYGLVISLFMLFAARQIFGIFITDPNIIPLGVSYLRIFATVQLIACIEAVISGAFRGLGKTKPPSIIAIIFNISRVFFALGLARTPLGLDGIWIGMAIGNLLRGGVLLIWYHLYSKKLFTLQEIDLPLSST
jgi:putative MATE family efflux protein